MFFLNKNSQWCLQWLSVLSVGLMLLVAGAVASEPDDGLGKADAQPNRLTGQVVLAEGQTASHANLTNALAICGQSDPVEKIPQTVSELGQAMPKPTL